MKWYSSLFEEIDWHISQNVNLSDSSIDSSNFRDGQIHNISGINQSQRGGGGAGSDRPQCLKGEKRGMQITLC